MTNLSMLTNLYWHMEWADAEVWKAVLGSENGAGDPKVRELFYHLHMVQRAFLRSWRCEPRDAPYPTFDDSRSLMKWGRTYYDEAYAHLRSLTNEQVSEEMLIPWAAMVRQRLGRDPDPTIFADTALQVVLHSIYHRGQINARLREIGGSPPLVDYIAWLWLGRPGAVWPEAWKSTDSEAIR